MVRFALGALLLLAACEPAPTLSAYERDILQERFEKDQSMRDPERSVLTRTARQQFAGLRYFPVDSTYRFILPLEPASPDTLRATLRKGGVDRYVRMGYVQFTLNGEPQRLTVFRPADSRDFLWLPFTDGTTNRESYGGGRYLQPELRDDGTLVVDFNQAYNPDCDYNPAMFNCALPPAENRITVRVEAGEMKSLIPTS